MFTRRGFLGSLFAGLGLSAIESPVRAEVAAIVAQTDEAIATLPAGKLWAPRLYLTIDGHRYEVTELRAEAPALIDVTSWGDHSRRYICGLNPPTLEAVIAAADPSHLLELAQGENRPVPIEATYDDERSRFRLNGEGFLVELSYVQGFDPWPQVSLVIRLTAPPKFSKA